MVKKEASTKDKFEEAKEQIKEKSDEDVVLALCKIKDGEAICYLPDREEMKKAASKAPIRITFDVDPKQSLGDYCKIKREEDKESEKA